MIILLRKVKQVVNTHKPVKTMVGVGVFVAGLSGLYTAVYMHFEGASFIEGIWQSWQTFTTVGYGNAPAATPVGRLFSMLLGTLGIASMAVFIAVMSDLRQYFKDRLRLGFMKNTFKDGYVILNWPGRNAASKMVEQIRNMEPNAPICFVDSELEELPPSIQADTNTRFFRGNLTERSTYEDANIMNNKAVIVFPKNADIPDADITTKSVVELTLKFTSPDTTVLYMLCDSENEWLFPKQATPIMKNFWVYTLVQEVQDRHSSALIKNLVNNSNGESIASLKVKNPPLADWGLIADRLRDNGVNPIGLKKRAEDGTILIPKEETVIEDGDTIFLACLDSKDLNELHRQVFR